jgi:hypothetical protein
VGEKRESKTGTSREDKLQMHFLMSDCVALFEQITRRIFNRLPSPLADYCPIDNAREQRPATEREAEERPGEPENVKRHEGKKAQGQK